MAAKTKARSVGVPDPHPRRPQGGTHAKEHALESTAKQAGEDAARNPNPGISHNGRTAGGLGPERVLEIQRARILAAMVEVSAERGMANVTVAHVVDRAGVSRRTFYELFDDREECFLAAFDDAIARVSRHVLDAYDPNAKWVQRIRSALTAVLGFLDVERGIGQLLIVGSLGAGHQAMERRRRAISQIISLIDQGRIESKTGGELPPLTAEGIAGGILSVLHSRLLDPSAPPAVRSPRGANHTHDSPVAERGLLQLTGPLMSMIVLPYLGPAAARRELTRPTPPAPSQPITAAAQDPLRELGMRLTYRTIRVLIAVAAVPGGSNRQVADESGITDQGQISKLLTRLHRLGLIENTGAPTTRGAPNSWVLTDRGWQVQSALSRNS